MSAITKEDQYSIVLRWSEPELYCLDLDPDHLHGYTHHHEGDVLALDEESDSDEFTIGDFACCVYDVAFASAHGESAFGLFDQSINSIHYYHALYDKKSARLRADVKQLVGRRTLEPNVLILDRLRIYPAHRGHDYGLLVLSTFRANARRISRPHPFSRRLMGHLWDTRGQLMAIRNNIPQRPSHCYTAD